MTITAAPNQPLDQFHVCMVDTGQNTSTGGRLKQVAGLLDSGTNLFTYGDGVSSVNILEVLHKHQAAGKALTLTAVKPPSRFGALKIDKSDTVASFKEKPADTWINGGFCVFEHELMKYLDEDGDYLEGAPLEQLVGERKVAAYKHDGFWASIDTPKDRQELEKLWAVGNAPWKVW